METREYCIESIKSCRICPRDCGVDRLAGERGFCRAPGQVILARAALHYWEEPCISGKAGSGAVFFSGCSLGCIFCQNAQISGTAQRIKAGHNTSAAERTTTQPKESADQRAATDLKESADQRTATDRKESKSLKNVSDDSCTRICDLPGVTVSAEHLADIFLRLQDLEHANNINLVTATHYIPHTVRALTIAKDRGLKIPVIYNSGGYEKVSSLRMLDGLIDVYLPDFKYMSPETAKRYSHAENYPKIAKAAIAEMFRQTGQPLFYRESNLKDSALLIRRGVIVRHLLLPGHVSEAKNVVSYLHETYGNSIYLSLMNQYTPMPAMKQDSLLGRKTTKREYSRLVDYALEIGVENGFIQEGETAKESFIPSWNGEGVR